MFKFINNKLYEDVAHLKEEVAYLKDELHATQKDLISLKKKHIDLQLCGKSHNTRIVNLSKKIDDFIKNHDYSYEDLFKEMKTKVHAALNEIYKVNSRIECYIVDCQDVQNHYAGQIKVINTLIATFREKLKEVSDK